MANIIIHRKTGNRIIDSIYSEPEKWKSTKYRFIHESGFSFWIANGFTYFRPERADFSFFDKIKAYRAFRWWCRNVPPEHFGNYRL